jgi:hypothetical protein
MPDATTPGRHPSRYGVWTRVPVMPQHAMEIEKLGYGALWVGGSQPAQRRFAEPILEKTTNLMVATALVNIWTAPVETVAQSFHLIDTTRQDTLRPSLATLSEHANIDIPRPTAVATWVLECNCPERRHTRDPGEVRTGPGS